jgi:hypothetical protein
MHLHKYYRWGGGGDVGPKKEEVFEVQPAVLIFCGSFVTFETAVGLCWLLAEQYRASYAVNENQHKIERWLHIVSAMRVNSDGVAGTIHLSHIDELCLTTKSRSRIYVDFTYCDP